MPEVSRFFGIPIRMYFDDHDPPKWPFRPEAPDLHDLSGDVCANAVSKRA